ISIIVVMVLLSGLLSFWQEYRSNKAAQALKSMISTTVYTIGSIRHDFINPSRVDIGGDSIREKSNNTWGEFGVGIQISVDKQCNIYGDVRYEHNFCSSKR
ncbi:autotransporter outer membrane beta-barrel domain-containing protein, partial [Snodgrassella communis]|uniref:autotransporter outer membrane beta-barrel domain-containing protein n=1 Tax=Snodgrassella communis TaxID=2946699 RepID=UPI001EF71A2B